MARTSLHFITALLRGALACLLVGHVLLGHVAPTVESFSDQADSNSVASVSEDETIVEGKDTALPQEDDSPTERELCDRASEGFTPPPDRSTDVPVTAEPPQSVPYALGPHILTTGSGLAVRPPGDPAASPAHPSARQTTLQTWRL